MVVPTTGRDFSLANKRAAIAITEQPPELPLDIVREIMQINQVPVNMGSTCKGSREVYFNERRFNYQRNPVIGHFIPVQFTSDRDFVLQTHQAIKDWCHEISSDCKCHIVFPNIEDVGKLERFIFDVNLISFFKAVVIPDVAKVFEKDLSVFEQAAAIRDFIKHSESIGRIDSLHLNNRHLTILPREIEYFTHLTELNLESNHLRVLPSEIKQLKQLERLFLQKNQFTVWPAEIRPLLPQLEILSLYNNQIAALPLDIRELAQVEVLDLSGNRLTAVPAEIGELAQLEVLSLSRNFLQTLPREIGRLSQLSSLFVRENRLIALPDTITDLLELRAIDIEGNEQLILSDEMKEFIDPLS